ncbi:MAG: hypothetical protein LUO96_06620 [Methanomicrobiales archaeon]|nr:hypothetical protein [Methanomicrobiales archaeon]
MIAAFYLGEYFCKRSQPLTGVLAFLVVSLMGVIVSCYLEAAIRELLKEFVARAIAARPHLFRSRKPRPASASHLS